VTQTYIDDITCTVAFFTQKKGRKMSLEQVEEEVEKEEAGQ